MKIRNNSYNNIKNGFTLVEIIVVVAIIGIFTVISIPNYGAYTKTLAVKGSAKDIRSLLWEAQALSLGPKDEKAISYFVDIDKADTDSKFELRQNQGTDVMASSATLNRFVSISSITADSSATDIGAVKISFDTGLTSGKSKDAGVINFSKIDGSSLSGGSPGKVIINLISSVSDSKYKLVIDKNLGSIVVSSN